MKTNGDEPAFACIDNMAYLQQGLSKREYFAAMALQGLCVGKVHHDIMKGQCVDIAQEANMIADALIEELNKQP